MTERSRSNLRLLAWKQAFRLASLDYSEVVASKKQLITVFYAAKPPIENSTKVITHTACGILPCEQILVHVIFLRNKQQLLTANGKLCDGGETSAWLNAQCLTPSSGSQAPQKRCFFVLQSSCDPVNLIDIMINSHVLYHYLALDDKPRKKTVMMGSVHLTVFFYFLE